MDDQDTGSSARGGQDGLASGRALARPSRSQNPRLERLSAYLDGWTTDRERAAIEHELAADSDARDLLDDLRLVRLALADLKTPRAPRSFALLAAAPRRSPSSLFRRLEWATRGAAGVAALAFAVALIRAPQVSESVTSAAPAFAQESAAGAAPVETPPAPRARESDRQTLDAIAPAAAPADSVSPAASTPAVAPPAAPTAGAATGAGAPAPAPRAAPAAAATTTPAPAAPAAAATPTPAPTPSTFAASGETPTPVATVEATRLAVAPPPAPTATPPATEITPTVAPTPDISAVKRADGANAPAPTAAPLLTPASTPALEPGPGTALPAATSEDSGEADVAPALGVLAVLLGLLALIERAGVRHRRA